MPIFDITQPTARQIIYLMTADEMCDFLYNNNYIDTDKFPSITSSDDLKSFAQTELTRWSIYLPWDMLSGNTLIAILALNRQDYETDLLFSGNSSAATSTSITIPSANGDFTGKTLQILDGTAEGRVRTITNWNNTTKVAAVSNWIVYPTDNVPDNVSSLTIKEPLTLTYNSILRSLFVRQMTPMEMTRELERHFETNPEVFLTEDLQNRFNEFINNTETGDPLSHYYSFGQELIFNDNLNDPETPLFYKHLVPLKQLWCNSELELSLTTNPKEPADLIGDNSASRPIPQFAWSVLSDIPSSRRMLYGGKFFPAVVIDHRTFTFNSVTSSNALSSGSFTITLDIGGGDLTTEVIGHNATNLDVKQALEDVLPGDHYAQVAFTYAGTNWNGFNLKIYNDDPTNWRFERNLPIISCSVTNNAFSTTSGATSISISAAGSYTACLLDQRYDDPTIVLESTAQNLSTINGTAQSQSHILTGTAQSASNAVTPSNLLHTITLATNASSSNDAYNDKRIEIVSGTGSGQYRTIADYAGSAKTAYVSGRWTTKPDNTSVYEIYNAKTIKLDSSDSAVNDFYINYRVEITAGTGSGQARNIDDYDSSTKIATLDVPWREMPDETSEYSLQMADAIKLNSGASGSDDFYNGMTISITSGKGIAQTRYISDYNGTTKIAKVSYRWVDIPDSTSEFTIKNGMGDLIESTGDGGGDAGIPFELPFHDHKTEWMGGLMDVYLWRLQQWALANQMDESELAVDFVYATAEHYNGYYPNLALSLEKVPSEYFLQLRDDPRWKNGIKNKYGRYIEEQVASGTFSSNFISSTIALQAWVAIGHVLEADFRGHILDDCGKKILGENFMGGGNYDEYCYTEAYSFDDTTTKNASQFGIGPIAGTFSSINTYSQLTSRRSTLIDDTNLPFYDTGLVTYPYVDQKIRSITRTNGQVTIELFSPDNYMGTTIHEGFAQNGDLNSITLSSAATAVDDAYTQFANYAGSSSQDRKIIITSGTGVGQSRLILDYNGTTKVALVDADWSTIPDSTSYYVITAGGATQWTGIITSASNGVTQATVVLDSSASSSNDAYGTTSLLIINNGSGKHQTIRVNNYVGSTRTLTLQQKFSVVPANGTQVTICYATLNDLGGSASRIEGNDTSMFGFKEGITTVNPRNQGSYTEMTPFIHPLTTTVAGDIVSSTANTLKLAYSSSLSTSSNFYVGARVHIGNGNTNTTPASGQDKEIIGYSVTGSSPSNYVFTITVDSNWDINPSSSYKYVIYHENPGFLVTDVGTNAAGNPYLKYSENLSPTRSDASVTTLDYSLASTSTGAVLWVSGVNDFDTLLCGIYANRVCSSSSRMPFKYVHGSLKYARGNLTTDFNLHPNYHYEHIIHSCLNGSFPGGLYWQLGDLSGCDYRELKKVYQVLDEVEELIETSYIPLPISVDFIKQNSSERYVISGMSGNSRRIYRISLQNAYNVKEDITTYTPGIISQSPAIFQLADGDTLTIPNSRIYTFENPVSEYGYWVIQENEETPVVNPPILDQISNVIILTGNTITFTATATTENSVIFTLSNAPTGATINSDTGEFSWTPTTAGRYSFFVRAIDENNLFDQQLVSVIVHDESRIPQDIGYPPLLSTGITGLTCKDFATEYNINTTWFLLPANSTQREKSTNPSIAYVPAITVCRQANFFVNKQ